RPQGPRAAVHHAGAAGASARGDVRRPRDCGRARNPGSADRRPVDAGAGFMSADLAGRVALVTGASAGIGFASAAALARRGAAVAIASRGGAKLEAARARLEAMGARVESFAADVAVAED